MCVFSGVVDRFNADLQFESEKESLFQTCRLMDTLSARISAGDRLFRSASASSAVHCVAAREFGLVRAACPPESQYDMSDVSKRPIERLELVTELENKEVTPSCAVER